jgi:hypothetical protein
MVKPPKMRPDVNEVAFRIVQAATGEGPRPEPPGMGDKNAEAVRRGAKGGKKGGKARAKALSPERRKKIARQAAKKRWS